MQELIGAVGELSPKERKALAVLLKQKGIDLFSVAPVFKRNASEPLLLSYAQERQWFLWQLEPTSTAYHVPAALRLRGQLDIQALQHSFNTLIARHETLRTTFVSTADGARQVIHAQWPLLIEAQTLPAGNPAQTQERLDAWLAGHSQQLFDLQAGPLLRVGLLRLAADEHVLVLTQHHIVSDGWSMQVMVDELVQLYAAYAGGRQPVLPALAVQYADFALWQRQWMEAGERDRQLSYWKDRLGGEQPVLALPLDHPRPLEQSFRGARHTLVLEQRLGNALKQLAQRQGVTLFTLLLTSFQALLHRYSGQADIRVGVPVANRTRGEIQGLIGFFVNTQVLKAEVDGAARFSDLLDQVKQALVEAQAHQDLPFEQLLEVLHPERNLSRSPLFQVMYNHQSDAQASKTAQLPGLTVDSVVLPRTTAQFDLTLDTHESPEGLSAALSYALDLFEAPTIEAMGRHWCNLLEAIVADPDQRIGTLPMLEADELSRTLSEWNPATRDWPGSGSLHGLIAAQAARRPEAIALSFQGQQLSYGDLNRQANRLAHRLIEQGVGPEVRVGLACERGFAMLVGLLAILKAGGAYVPLDPQYPQDRLAYMIDDSGIALVLAEPGLLASLPLPQGLAVLTLGESLEAYAEHDPVVPHDPDNLAYVIYTSGSTGKPKGTLLAHRNVLRLFSATQAWFNFGAQDVWTLFHSYAFDFSVWEIFGALTLGGRLVIVPHEVSRSPEAFFELLCREQVTVLNQTPSAFRQLLPVACAPEHGQRTHALRYVVFGGEALEVNQLRPWFERFGERAPQLINMYGITETTVHVTYRPLSLADLGQGASSPIGEPISDLSWYLLDGELNPVAKGCTGELYIGRAGLARGYLNRADLSATRFIPDPFAADGGRLYRTGDLARYRRDGVIEYVGRIDQQVKIRGFRIELGEIQARLQAATQVREALVLAQPGPNGQQLVAYVVAQSTPVDPGQLRETLKQALKQDLPDYMVPAHLLFIEQLPLTSNGKLDRKALPLPDASQLQQAYVAPQSELEQRIAAIWQEVLKLERVGLTDNFFELGGDSIISIQVVSRARQAGIRFTPKELFQHQTVQGLASVAQLGEGGPLIDQRTASGTAELLPIQQVFFASDTPEPQHWNQSVLLKPASRLQVAVLQRALQALIEQHDALRLSFSQGTQGWSAAFKPAPAVEDVLWQVEADSLEAVEALGESAQRSLDLSEGPLLRALLINLADGEQRLLLVIHHLVVDGVSWRVLFEDLQSAYRQAQSGQTPTLPARTTSVQAWAEQLREYARSPALQAELGYWQGQLAGADGGLPLDHPNGGRQNKLARSVHSQLDRDTTRRLLQQAPAAYRTQVNDLLLTALARVLTRWTGSDSLLVQLEGHGREELFDGVDLTRTVGWFTSMFPVRLHPAEGLGDSLKQIKEQLRAIPNKGLGYGALRYLGDDQAQTALSELAQAHVTFNYLGQFDGSFDQSTALFRPTGEARGAEKSAEAVLGETLSINGQVYDGQLSLGWTFSGEQFDSATIQRLADAYALELAALVEHCCQPQVHGVTPSDFPLACLDQAQLDSLPVPVAQLEDLYPLSPMQQGMLFHTLYEQSAGDYINQMRIAVDGLDPQRFQQAWTQAMQAHAVLRSGFLWQGLQQPLQWVDKATQVPFIEHDWRGRPDLEAALEALAQAQRQQGFDLSNPPLLRLVLVRTGDNSYHLIYTNHHVLMDGWSNSQLLGEVLQRYSGQALAAPQGLYRDYISWLQQQDAEACERFWKAQAQNLAQPTLLARVCTAGGVLEPGYGDYRSVLDAERTQRLGAFAKRAKVTVNTVLQAAWLLLLQRYSGQATVCFGATVSGRPAELKGVEQQIGLFINTLPVIATPRPQQTLDSWLQAVQAQNLALREQEHTPLFDIQRWAGQGGEALFDNILVFENYPVAEALQQASPQDLRFGDISNREQANYPLTLAVSLGECLALHFSYDGSCFDAGVVAQLDRHLVNLLMQMVEAKAAMPLSELQLLQAGEQLQTLAEWNPATRDWPVTGSLHGLIAAQAARRPEAIALSFQGQQLSYGDLNRQANRLAHRLIEQGVGPEVRVGLACERGFAMLVGLLAILKAGGAYVPLDPQYPQDRLAYMIDDSGIALVLAEPGLLASLPLPQGLAVLTLGEPLEAYAEHDPVVPHDPDNLAYVIYTSGSTGKPKGTLLAHRNVLRLFSATQAWFNFGAQDVWTLFHSYAFDFSVWEIFGALTLGGRLLIVPHEVSRSPEAFFELLCREQVTVLNQTPSAFRQLLPVACAPEHGQRTHALRYVVFGGEALEVNQLRPWFERFGERAPQLINMYGITETTVHVTYRPLSLADLGQGASSPIGEPISDLSWYLLDGELNPVAKGCTGELYIGRAGLARGYLNRADLSATRFIPDPFAADGGRLYRTGDLARYRRDGVIEYVGRIDQQVKIRGFRIELGEIQARLQAATQVREALVLAQPGPNGQQLVAYVVAQSTPVDPGQLRETLKQALKQDLPDYMVPAHLLFIEQLPLTSNGKLDRKALPLPDASQLQQAYVAPQSELEQRIAAIWQEVLKLERVGLADNFFELGGHSLLVVNVVSRIQLEEGLKLSPQLLFQYPTLGTFVEQLAESGEQLNTSKLNKLESLLDEMEEV
ncbi:amino acid adenylation domain-containing protein [Pseudomonas tructae]|uniref:Amino acid adenylation domain-containing protein n=1 Tax=Pseudomonas tructae TaxID=2518644 RepID=A0A411ML05_9PSED|nr:non-ribosomal peptide synthetase [Pseudomonas tructae]QBF27506.1 amino acid adenylation domain-containing protein [Pseudomonas tructae]